MGQMRPNEAYQDSGNRTVGSLVESERRSPGGVEGSPCTLEVVAADADAGDSWDTQEGTATEQVHWDSQDRFREAGSPRHDLQLLSWLDGGSETRLVPFFCPFQVPAQAQHV